MGCSVSRLHTEEVPLPPRPTAPPPPPLSALTYVTEKAEEDHLRGLAAFSGGAVFGGVGFSSSTNSAQASHEALSGARVHLSAKRGQSTSPSLAIVFCGEAIEDAEEVRCQIVRTLPELRLHGVASAVSLMSPQSQSVGSASSKSKPMLRTGVSAAGGVGCLLLDAPEGSFAAAWDDMGDALYAARWLQEQMPDVQAIIMAAVPADEERALEAVQTVFPGVPVHGGNLVKAMKWMTLSHLGSANRGVSLVGIAPHVGFGAAAAAITDQNFEGGKISLTTCLQDAYSAAEVAGDLKTVHAGILMCGGIAGYEGIVASSSDASVSNIVEGLFGDVPILGVSCEDEGAKVSGLDAQTNLTISFMLFGERHTRSSVPIESDRAECSQSTCVETRYTEELPGTPSTASTEIRRSPRLTTI